MSAPDFADLVADLESAVAFNVRRLRRAKGWTQHDLAAAAGLTRNGVWVIERGNKVRLETVLRLMLALGATPDDVFAPHGEPLASAA